METKDGSSRNQVSRMVLNPNQEIVSKVINRIYLNNGHCPCQVVDPDKDTRCPCLDFLEHRKCHCSLFVNADG